MAEETFAATRQKIRDQAAFAYQQAVNFDTYQRFKGVQPIPVMGPVGTPPVLARVHAPYGIRKAEFEYARDRVPPPVPAPADSDSGDTILSAEYVFPTPRVNANGSLTYGVKGELVFVQPLDGRGTESEFPMSLHPFVSPLDAVHTKPGPSGDGEDDLTWQWNSKSYDMRTLGSYGILE
jgi:hypothetical protein